MTAASYGCLLLRISEDGGVCSVITVIAIYALSKPIHTYRPKLGAQRLPIPFKPKDRRPGSGR